MIEHTNSNLAKGQGESSSVHGASENGKQREQQLFEELTSLRVELNHVKAERDEYLRYIYGFMDSEIKFDKKKLLELGNTQKPFLQFIQELDQSSMRA